MPEKYYKRTFEASWDVFEGQVYEDYLAEVHRRHRNEFCFILQNGTRIGGGLKIVRLEEVVAGMDWGFGSGHPAALVVGGKSRGRWYVLEDCMQEGIFVAPPGQGSDSWVTRAKRLVCKWGISSIYCDNESPENIQVFKRHGLPAKPAIKDVLEGIQAVATALHVEESTGEPGMFILESAPGCLDEVAFYHWKEGAAKEQPDKTGDHCMDALRYMVYTHEKRGAFRREPQYDAVPA
jgi:hypothetical protein